jgi:hypothetical protein
MGMALSVSHDSRKFPSRGSTLGNSLLPFFGAVLLGVIQSGGILPLFEVPVVILTSCSSSAEAPPNIHDYGVH